MGEDDAQIAQRESIHQLAGSSEGRPAVGGGGGVEEGDGNEEGVGERGDSQGEQPLQE